MSPINYTFDANQFKPQQSVDKHPIGKYPFTVSNTSCEQTKDQQGGMFIVEFTTPAGRIVSRYNLWNNHPKAVEIAHGQLSALCHATGVFRLDFNNDGAALRNARGVLEVGWQKGEEPTPEKPEGGYVEVKKVYDTSGNEPGRAPAAAPQPQPQATPAAPLQAAPNGAWAPNGGQQQQTAQPAPWGGNQPAGGSFQQGAPQPNPPWGNRT